MYGGVEGRGSSRSGSLTSIRGPFCRVFAVKALREEALWKKFRGESFAEEVVPPNTQPAVRLALQPPFFGKQSTTRSALCLAISPCFFSPLAREKMIVDFPTGCASFKTSMQCFYNDARIHTSVKWAAGQASSPPSSTPITVLYHLVSFFSRTMLPSNSTSQVGMRWYKPVIIHSQRLDFQCSAISQEHAL